MGEIIKFDFANKKFIGRESTQDRSSDMNYSNFEQSHLTGIIRQITDLSASKSAFISNQEMVRNYSNEELSGWLRSSSEKDWRAKPAFFRAIASEFLSRGLLKKESA